jgi:hypothetical protein
MNREEAIMLALRKLFNLALMANADGSLDLYIQAESPADKEANWLPVSKASFNLLMRL